MQRRDGAGAEAHDKLNADGAQVPSQLCNPRVFVCSLECTGGARLNHVQAGDAGAKALGHMLTRNKGLYQLELGGNTKRVASGAEDVTQQHRNSANGNAASLGQVRSGKGRRGKGTRAKTKKASGTSGAVGKQAPLNEL